ncbi:MAG: apolipoprotein N-acyltransferase [Candidatus Kapabacteria bacterium]|nr:apolipoprotein N-acyltransferase [Candidatus Kapabacteria bacterium]
MSAFSSSALFRSIFSGVLLGLAFPQVVGGFAGVIAFVAFVPLLLALADNGVKQTRWKLIGQLYATFVIFHGLTNWWVCSWQEQTDPYLFASGFALWLGHPFFLMMPFVALASIRKRLGVGWMLLCTPLAISGFEWLHGQTDASYPWLTTGYSLVHTPFAQIADTVGVYGLSFLISVVNVIIVYVLLKKRTGDLARKPILIIAALVLIWGAIGLVKQLMPSSSSGTINVMLVQPNEDPWEKWGDAHVQVLTHQNLVDSAHSAGRNVDLVVWSETAIPYTIRDPRYEPEWEALRSWTDTSDFSLITGYADMMVYPIGQAPPSSRQSKIDRSIRFDIFNAAMLINPHHSDVQVHRKSMLTPFAERLPFADQLTFAMSWIEWGVGISSWGKGQTRNPLPVVKGADTIANVGTIICIESIYPEVARDLVNNGADVLCIITNDAWYNRTWGPEQHFDIARMRAIEQRRSIVRCANSGITGFILPDGTDSPHPAISPLTKGVAIDRVQKVSTRTVYAVVGDPIPIFGLIFTLVAFIAARFPLFLRNLPFRFTSIENKVL